VKDRVKANLERAALISGRSISEEIEHRVERYSEDQKLTIVALGGPRSQGLVETLLDLLDLLERRGMDWTADPDVALGVQRAFPIIMETVQHSPLPLDRQKFLLAEARRANEPKTARIVELLLLLLQMLGLAQEPSVPEWTLKLEPGYKDQESGQ
jgi:hypothetical protein